MEYFEVSSKDGSNIEEAVYALVRVAQPLKEAEKPDPEPGKKSDPEPGKKSYTQPGKKSDTQYGKKPDTEPKKGI